MKSSIASQCCKHESKTRHGEAMCRRMRIVVECVRHPHEGLIFLAAYPPATPVAMTWEDRQPTRQ
eukprot:127349-Amphidinium_carterae.2